MPPTSEGTERGWSGPEAGLGNPAEGGPFRQEDVEARGSHRALPVPGAAAGARCGQEERREGAGGLWVTSRLPCPCGRGWDGGQWEATGGSCWDDSCHVRCGHVKGPRGCGPAKEEVAGSRRTERTEALSWFQTCQPLLWPQQGFWGLASSSPPSPAPPPPSLPPLFLSLKSLKTLKKII